MRKGIALFLAMLLCTAMLSGCMEIYKPEQTAPALEEVTGELYDTGAFRALVPNGWTAFPVADVFAPEPDTIKTDCFNIIRGGTKASDVKTKIYICLEFYGPGVPMEEPDPSIFADSRDIAPMQVGEHLWYGFVGTDMYGRARLGTSAVLWTREGESRYLASFPLEFNKQTLSLEDPELLAILASLSPSDN